MDTLLNNATNEQSKDADKTKYQERIKVLSDTQQAFLNFWNLYYNNIPLITQATDDFTQSVANGDDSVKALNDAINSGDDITLTSEAYKEAANLANKYGVSVDELIKNCKLYMMSKVKVAVATTTGGLMRPETYRISSLILLTAPATVINRPRLLNPPLRTWASKDT